MPSPTASPTQKYNHKKFGKRQTQTIIKQKYERYEH